MDLEIINKKRKRITFLSLVLTIIIMIIAVLLFVLGFTNTYFLISSIIFLVLALFLLSKFLIMPLYFKLKANIQEDFFKNKFDNFKVIPSKNKYKFLENYYNLKSLRIDNKFTYILDNNNYEIVNINEIEQQAFKKSNSIFFGRLITLENDKLSNISFSLIKDDFNETEKYLRFNKPDYTNQKEIVSKKYKKYHYLYNETEDLRFINIFDDLDLFTFLKIENNKLVIIFEEKYSDYNFKLQNELTLNYLIDYKNSLNNIVKIIERVEKIINV